MGQADWLTIMVRAAQGLDTAPFGVAIVDPCTGAIRHHNPAMAALLGQALPPDLGGLDALRLVPAATREELLALARSLDDEDSCTTIRTRILRPEGPSTEAEVFVSHLHAFRGGGSVISVLASDLDNAFDNQDIGLSPYPAKTLYFAYDLDLVAIGTDPRLADYGIDPASQVGTHGLLMGHPVDVLRTAPLARSVASGTATEASYILRVATPAGRWTNVRCSLNRLAGDDPVIMAAITPRDHHLESVPPGLLTNRELEIARALFSGRHPAQIAEWHQVSVHTVRNQVGSLLKKLGVASQAELTTRYARPHRPTATRIRQAVSPRDRQ